MTKTSRLAWGYWVVLCSLMVISPALAEEPSIHNLNQRLRKLEAKGGGGVWADRITISGVIEAQADFISESPNDGDDTDASDIYLATVDLAIDVEIARHVSGHVLFCYTGDDDDPVMEVDEGFITLDGKDVMPVYLMAGKIYVPFGNYASHMITDPLTLDLGETVEGTLQAGLVNDWIDVGLAVYRGSAEVVDEDGDDIADVALGVKLSLPEGTVTDLGLSAGVSYISNIADSGGLGDALATAIEDKVAGIGGFIRLSFKEMIFLEVEYITALDEFKAAELGAEDDVTPSAFNLELAYAPLEHLEVAARYGTSEDTADNLAETQFGVAVAYGLFENSTLSMEYLKSAYENDDEVSSLTTVLAIEF